MEKVNNLNKGIKSIKVSFIVLGICLLIGNIYFFNRSYNMFEKSREKVYVLKDGAALELALSRNANDNRKAEVKNHIEMFHQFFFNLDPDPNDIKKSINRALYLIDDSGKQLHYARDEKNYYHQLVQGNISSRVVIDSVVSDMSKAPYVCKVFGRQKIVRKTRVVFKKIEAVCQLRNMKRTDSNPHGLLIERYRLTDNTTYDERAR